MKRTITAVFIAAAALCACTGPATEERAALIPQPCEIDYQAGSFTLPEGLEIAVASRELAPQAGYLTEALAKYTDASISEGTSGDVVLAIDPAMETEEYTLDVRRSGIRISGGSCRGVVNGIATLRQLLPAGAGEKAEVPCVKVSDRPAFGWRGAMLDVSRHFFDKGEIFRMLDQMAVLKLNKFHWHLTDDQGWRIEIKKYPDLTEKGGWRHFNKHDRICMERAEQQLNDDYLIPEKNLRINGADTLYGVHRRMYSDYSPVRPEWGYGAEWYKEIRTDHNIFSYVSKEKYGKEHPEFFTSYTSDETTFDDVCYMNGLNDDGSVKEVICTHIPESKSGNDTSGIKVKGVVQWVDAKNAVDVEIRKYEHLLKDEEYAGQDFSERMNTESVHKFCGKVEPYVMESEEKPFQFMRVGYYKKLVSGGKVVLSEIVSLKDNFNK